ncbi:hypothetical protein Tco_0575433 [Tanacetum coccineum]
MQESIQHCGAQTLYNIRGYLHSSDMHVIRSVEDTKVRMNGGETTGWTSEVEMTEDIGVEIHTNTVQLWTSVKLIVKEVRVNIGRYEDVIGEGRLLRGRGVCTEVIGHGARSYVLDNCYEGGQEDMSDSNTQLRREEMGVMRENRTDGGVEE